MIYGSKHTSLLWYCLPLFSSTHTILTTWPSTGIYSETISPVCMNTSDNTTKMVKESSDLLKDTSFSFLDVAQSYLPCWAWSYHIMEWKKAKDTYYETQVSSKKFM